MPKLNRLPLFAVMIIGLASCGGPATSSPSTTSDPSTSTPTTSIEEPTSDISTFEPLTTNEFSEGSHGGWLIDIGVNQYLFTDETYDCTFNPDHTVKDIRITSSHEEVLTITPSTTEKTSFTINTHNVGDSILCIYDADDMLVYRKVVRVRTRYSAEEIPTAVFNNDVYDGNPYLGDHTLFFLEEDPFKGLFKGSDDFEANMEYEITMTYNSYNSDFKAYEFDIETTKRDETSTTVLTSMLISPAADFIALYYSNGLLNLFFPRSLVDLHPEIAK